jgi:hypothetical protein
MYSLRMTGFPWLMVLFAAATLHSGVLRADARVNLCTDADQGGSGMNLRTAFTQSANPSTLVNAITFDCPGASVLKVTSSLAVTQATRIDGGNTVSLSANEPTYTPMFVLASSIRFFYLDNLQLRDSETLPLHTCLGGPLGVNCGLTRILTAHDYVELRNVTVSGVRYPFGMQGGTFNIYGSHFLANAGGVLHTGGPSSVLIDGSEFNGNQDVALSVLGSLTIQNNSSFVNNGTLILGPASGAPCTLTIERSSFSSNGTTNFGAILTSCDSAIGHSSFVGNTAAAPGAALYLSGQNVTLRADTFQQNRTGVGLTAAVKSGSGAISWTPANGGGTMTVLYSSFQGNLAGAAGGAILVGRNESSPGPQTLNIGATSFGQNTAVTNGGAIAAYGTRLHTARVIFAANSAAGSGGAVYLSNASPNPSGFANTLFVRNRAGVGSAFYGDGAAFVNSTVFGNAGLGITVFAPARAAALVSLSNTIVAANTGGGCSPKGVVDDLGSNLQFPATDCARTIPVADPQLDSMYIPLPRGASLGHGNSTVCAAAPVGGGDVYGVARSPTGHCSIGAAEGDVEVLGGGWIAYRDQPSAANNYQSTQTKLEALLRAAGFGLAVHSLPKVSF